MLFMDTGNISISQIAGSTQVNFKYSLHTVNWIDIPKDKDYSVEFAIECMRDSRR